MRSFLADCGHGHVYKNTSGMKVRCGGPGICSLCSQDLANKAMNEGIDPIIKIVAEPGSDKVIGVEHAVSELYFKESVDGNCLIGGLARPISEKGLSDLCVAWLKFKRPGVIK